MQLRRIALLFFLLSFLFLFFPLPEPLSLLKIKKERLEVLKSLNIKILEELDTCYIGLATDSELSSLKSFNIGFSILERDMEGKDFFLVYSRSPEDIKKLEPYGKAIQLEKNTILFWQLEGRGIYIPQEFQKKRLSKESITDFLRIHPKIELAEGVIKENEIIPLIINEVSEDNLFHLIDILQNFQTRYASTRNCEDAGDFIYSYLQNLGLETYFQSFSFRGYSSRNVIAEKKGKTSPEDIFIICAHYDSTSNIPTIFAPGADDNASGTSAVLESARIIVKYPLDFTVRFICFSAEEWGLYGSTAYSLSARNRNEKIIGVMNFDMIAYTDNLPEDLEIIVNPSSEWLAERTILASKTYYEHPIRKIVSTSFVYSDHASFWQRGYDAFCAIEDNPIRNPYYHTTYDTLNTLNIDFLKSVVRVGLAILSDLSQPIRPGYPETPKGLRAKYVVYKSLFNSIKNIYLSWNRVEGATGYNVYRTTLSRLNYQRLNITPVLNNYFEDKNLKTGISYYYVVSALDSAGNESNYSQEVGVIFEKGNSREKFFLFYYPSIYFE